MPSIEQKARPTVEVRHEHFCLPRPDQEAPRIEGFVAYVDTDAGRSEPALYVTRCLECGAATYERMENRNG